MEGAVEFPFGWSADVVSAHLLVSLGQIYPSMKTIKPPNGHTVHRHIVKFLEREGLDVVFDPVTNFAAVDANKIMVFGAETSAAEWMLANKQRSDGLARHLEGELLVDICLDKAAVGSMFCCCLYFLRATILTTVF